jgi:maltose alpha-D-glucosyltransferase/alpha-amylase
VTLAPYGFYWFQLSDEGDHPEVASAPEFVTLVVSDWSSLWQGRTRTAFEQDVLPGFLSSRRWFGEKNSRHLLTRIHAVFPFPGDDPRFVLVLIDVETERGAARYALPLAVLWSRFDRINAPISSVVATLRRGAREGTLVDAAGERSYVEGWLQRLHAGDSVEMGNSRIDFRPTRAFEAMETPQVENARVVEKEQSNTSVLADNKYVIKILRRVNPGLHPEVEIGRFLTDVAGFSNVPALLGAAELAEGEQSSALAVVHAFVENQGDAWSVTGAYLDRFVDEQRLLSSETAAESEEQSSYLIRMRQIGRRTAEMQTALASRDDIPDFAPEPITPEDVQRWTATLLQNADRAFDDVARRRSQLSEATRAVVDALLEAREQAMESIRTLLPPGVKGLKARHHGDFHLGQMLFAKDDVYIIDFEGEPQRSLEERRRKAPPARDVAGLIRSIDYSIISAYERAVRTVPDEHGRLFQALESWREASEAAFLAAYREALANPYLWPEEKGDADRLLRFFLLEKAIYEIDYELNNRPAWLHVPLSGVRRILELAKA